MLRVRRSRETEVRRQGDVLNLRKSTRHKAVLVFGFSAVPFLFRLPQTSTETTLPLLRAGRR